MLNSSELKNQSDNGIQGSPLPLCDSLGNWLHKIKLRQSSIFRDIERFGSWVEFEGSELIQKASEGELMILPIGATEEMNLQIGRHRYPHKLGEFHRLWAFLAGLGIDKIVIDGRLERNQIEDVMSFIHLHREDISRCMAGRHCGQVGTELCRLGVHLACSLARIQDGTLEIRYSYCQLRLSKLVQWFEKRQRDFRDHRALFYAAPRYAMMTGLISLGPSLVITLVQQDWLMLSVILGEAVILMFLVYLFFMVVGSIEYDNEEKAYQLSQAFGRLKMTNERIQADVKRARVVQEKFLPDLEDMPYFERLEWARHFEPAEEVGGDYFDVYRLEGFRVAILFSDVSGHGMAAAFITAILKTTFQQGMENGDSVAELMRKMNTRLYRSTPVGSFAAVWMGILNIANGELEYANGGHHPLPVWIRNGNGQEPQTVVVDGARNLLLGVEEDISFRVTRQKLADGDTVMWVSDGIVECMNMSGMQFGSEALQRLAAEKASGSVTALVDSVVQEVNNFVDGREAADDRTILAVRIKAGVEKGQAGYEI